MKSKSVFLLCLILLVIAVSPHVPSVLAASIPDIGLGFGPSNVQPVAEGIPIYSQGDNVWLESYYNSMIVVQLLHPSGASASQPVVVEPGQLFKLYTFGENDYSGQWMLFVTWSGASTSIPLVLSSPNSSLTPIHQGASLTENRLDQTFALPPTDAYNIQVCSVGESIGSTASFVLAGGSNGSIRVSLDQNTSRFSVSQTSSSLSTWLELYSQYSYSVAGEGMVSQDLMVAGTPVLSVSPPGTTQYIPLVQQMPLRQGRFDLRVFERTTAGLSLQDAPFLRTSNGTWISLEGCTSMASVSSREFVVATDLDSANSSWPRHLFTLYTMNGQESYSESDVPGREAAIHLKDSPEGKPLMGVTITASATGLQPSEWDAFSSAVYVLTSGLPSTISIGLSFGGVVDENLNVSVPGPYTSKSLSVQAGTLVASATFQGKTQPNATIAVAAAGSQPVAIGSKGQGSVSILLPPGNYTLSATYAGNSVSKVVLVSEGHISTANLEFSRPSFPTLLYALAATGVLGLLLNVFVWRQYVERRKVYG